ncbi:MAG: glycerol kinase [Holophagaceae bacterium]|nr:glycerol kinase [Holophagaceae bacterium]
MPDLILALDQGTSGSTALVLDRELCLHGRATVEFPQHFPQAGWVEHDPDEIWASVQEAIRRAITGLDPARIAAIGITNQRETTFIWDAATGQSIGPAIVWQDRRTSGVCAGMKAHESRVRELTGLPLDPYFSATKLAWLKAQHPGRHLAFGTSDSFLIHRLTGEHLTDPSNASRTQFFDIHQGTWSDELIALFGLEGIKLPRVVPSSGVCARIRNVMPLPDGIPIAGIAGDQQAALFGQGCFDAGQAKVTYGTGSFVLMNAGPQPIASQHGLLGTVAWNLGTGLAYALEGGTYIAGALIQWLRDGLGIITSAAEVEALAASVPDSGGVTIIPALAGLGAPHWRPEARGLISGITRGTTRAHIARAALESIAHSQCDILEAMAAELGRPLLEVRVDGGASANNLLMQMQADLSGVTLLRPKLLEATALGAGMLAGLGMGWWSGQQELRAKLPVDRAFKPGMPKDKAELSRQAWSAVRDHA